MKIAIHFYIKECLANNLKLMIKVKQMRKFILFVGLFVVVNITGCKKENQPAPCPTCDNTGVVRFVPKGDYYYKVKLGDEWYGNQVRKNSHAPVYPHDCEEECLECADMWTENGNYTYFIYRFDHNLNDSLVQTGTVTVSDGSCKVINCEL